MLSTFRFASLFAFGNTLALLRLHYVQMKTVDSERRRSVADKRWSVCTSELRQRLAEQRAQKQLPLRHVIKDISMH